MRIGPLNVSEIPAEGQELGTVILFHGFRASAEDLVSLSKLSKQYRWLFPDGPIDCRWLPLYKSRAWFEIDLEQLHALSERGEFNVMVRLYKKELEQAALSAKELLKIETPRLILGGFSQGAMLATHLALQSPHVEGLAAFSGSLVNLEQWEELASKRKGLTYYMSHGRDDEILPFFLGQQLEAFFKKHGFQGLFHPFSGGHEIPSSSLEHFRNFLINK